MNAAEEPVVPPHRHGSSGARSSVLRVLFTARGPLPFAEIQANSCVEYSRAREIVRQLVAAHLVRRVPPEQRREPSQYTLTPAGLSVAHNHLRLVQLQKVDALEERVDGWLDEYRVPDRYRKEYKAIVMKYLMGVPMTTLMAEFGNYERIRAALTAMHVPQRSQTSGNAHPST